MSYTCLHRLKFAEIMVCVGLLLLGACSFDTPAEIHEKLVPVIAEELIKTQRSERVHGLTSQVEQSLKRHAPQGIAYEIGAPEVNEETGVRFYSKPNHTLFLVIGLNLHESENSYILGEVLEVP